MPIPLQDQKTHQNSQEYKGEDIVQFYEKWTRMVNRQPGEEEGEEEGEWEEEEDGEHAGGHEDKRDTQTIFFKEAMKQCYKWLNRRERRAFYRRALHLLKFYKRRCESCHSIEFKINPQRLWDKLADLDAKIQRQDFIFMSQDEERAVIEALHSLCCRHFKIRQNGDVVHKRKGVVVI